MNAANFVTFYTYMLRENVIRFQRELLADFKLATGIKKLELHMVKIWSLMYTKVLLSKLQHTF